MDEQLNNNTPKCKCTCTGKVVGEKIKTVTNTVHVRAKDMNDIEGNCAEEDLKIRKRYTLTIKKHVSPEVAEPSEPVVYTITVTNESNSTMAAENVVVTDDIPNEISIDKVTSDKGTVDSSQNSIKVTIPMLGIGQTVTIKIEGHVK